MIRDQYKYDWRSVRSANSGQPPSPTASCYNDSTRAVEEMNSSNGGRVCVTGGAGFIGSWLVKKLLERGYTVHATLRNVGDEAKAGLLRGLVPGAADSGRLVLFEADLYDAATFAPAIAGCQFVFLIATPFLHDATSTKYKSTVEAALDAARVILRLCAESKTVKRVIHTGSMAASSPLKEDSSGFKHAVDESCWTPLDVDYPHRNEHFHEYTMSKLLSEKELLAYNESESPGFEVVTVPCSVVAGDTLQDHTTVAHECVLAPVTWNERHFGALRMLQRLMGSVPVAHVDDVCDALFFCMERPSMAGRFLCAAAYPTIYEIIDHFANKYPHLDLLKETEVLPTVHAHSNKLGELGFRYKYGMEEILDGSIQCAVRVGSLDPSTIGVQE